MPAVLLLVVLTLNGGHARDLPRYQPAVMKMPAPALRGPTWTLTALSTGGAPITPGRLLVRPSLRIVGTVVSGSTGCSPLKARIQVQGQAAMFRAIDPGPSDHCPDHALALREDFTFLLGRVTRYEVRGQALTLSAGAGWLEFTATR